MNAFALTRQQPPLPGWKNLPRRMSALSGRHCLLLPHGIVACVQPAFPHHALCNERSFVLVQDFTNIVGAVTRVVVPHCDDLVSQSMRRKRGTSLTGNWLHTTKTAFGSQQTPTQSFSSIC